MLLNASGKKHGYGKQQSEKRPKSGEKARRQRRGQVMTESNERTKGDDCWLLVPFLVKVSNNHGKICLQLLSLATLVPNPGRLREARPPQYNKGQQQITIINSRTQLGKTAPR